MGTDQLSSSGGTGEWQEDGNGNVVTIDGENVKTAKIVDADDDTQYDVGSDLAGGSGGVDETSSYFHGGLG